MLVLVSPPTLHASPVPHFHHLKNRSLFLSLLLNEIFMGNHDKNERKEFYYKLKVKVLILTDVTGVG